MLQWLTAVSGSDGGVNAQLSRVAAQDSSVAKQDPTTGLMKVTRAVMERTIMKWTPGQTANHSVLVNLRPLAACLPACNPESTFLVLL